MHAVGPIDFHAVGHFGLAAKVKGVELPSFEEGDEEVSQQDSSEEDDESLGEDDREEEGTAEAQGTKGSNLLDPLVEGALDRVDDSQGRGHTEAEGHGEAEVTYFIGPALDFVEVLRLSQEANIESGIRDQSGLPGDESLRVRDLYPEGAPRSQVACRRAGR